MKKKEKGVRWGNRNKVGVCVCVCASSVCVMDASAKR